MKRYLLSTLLLVFATNLIFSQRTGDYRSIISGPWDTVTSWEYFNGTAWVTPLTSSPQGYPGQYAVTAGAVLIQKNDVISVGTSGISTELLGTITITGTLKFTGDINSTVNSTIKTSLIVVTPNHGFLSMLLKVTLYVPVDNAVIEASAKGLLAPDCSNNQTIILGLSEPMTIDCNGNLKYDYVEDDGGTPNAVPTSNTPVCEGNYIHLFGNYAGLGIKNPVTYAWTIIDPNNVIVTPSGTAQNPIITSPIVGEYKATLKCIATYSSRTYSNFETIYIKVNTTPTVPIIGAVKPIDCNSMGSVVLNGLPAGNWVIYPGGITGSGTSAAITGLATGSLYSFSVTNQFGCTSPATTGSIVITDQSSSTWNGSTWSNGTPTITTNVILAGNYDTSTQANITACSITVNNGCTLTVADGKFVTIQNNLTVSTRAVINIANQGSLVMINDAGTLTNNGTMKVNKTTTPFEKFDYTYWSGPITTTPISYAAGTTFANWRSDHAYHFNPANFLDVDNDGFDDNQDDWIGATNMNVQGRGYIIMGRTWGDFPATESVVFTANDPTNTLNSGEINVPIALTPGTPMDDDWNLVGNPYPSAIDATKFINNNFANIDATLYFWTHKANLGGELNLGPDALNFSQSDYAMFNLSGGTGTAKTVSTTGSKDASINSIPQGYIASCQGFFVEAQNNVNLIFNNSMRIGEAVATANTQFYKMTADKETTKAKDRLWLNMENKEGMFSQQLVAYFEDTTNDIDNGYDGLLNDGGNYINFYSFINEGTYKIQGRKAFDASDEVRLGYFSAVAGNFEINIDSKEGVFTTNAKAVFLEDKLLGVLHNLEKGPYRFDTESGTFDDRFVLRYTDNTLGNESFNKVENTVLVSNANKQITIHSAIEIIDKIQVYDLSGRSIYQKKEINDNEFTITNVVANRQMLMVKTTLQNGKTATKKIIY